MTTDAAKRRGMPEFAIAVVGMSGRFPGARTVDAFWDNLVRGVHGITTLDTRQLIEAGATPELAARPDCLRSGGLLEDIDLFDAAFFDIPPAEAATMDPQHRIFLEIAWEALEHAGYAGGRGARRVGVFAGACVDTYLLHVLMRSGEASPVDEFLWLAGNDRDYLSTRVSYKLDLRGPSVNVQTACSTSLVAVHYACESLLAGDSDLAIAGGVTVRVPQFHPAIHQAGGMFSLDGKCRAFDAEGSGTVVGNGAAVVVLKRLEDALADRDSIHAVILGTAVNNDGADKPGYTAPSVSGQRDVIRAALARAAVDASTISYVECHGTATPLGDPIEVLALTQAFAGSARTRGSCGIGSVKSNIGHLDTASGVAGLIKTVLALRHRHLPPSLHFASPNPEIDFASGPFFVVDEGRPWVAPPHPLRAGVSSFGVGGTNAHAVLEEAPDVPDAPTAWRHHVLPVSARTPGALRAAAERLRDALCDGTDAGLADVAYTLQAGRRAMRHRLVLLVQDRRHAVDALDAVLGSAIPERPAAARRLRLVFPDRPPTAAALRELRGASAAVRDALSRCASALGTSADLENSVAGTCAAQIALLALLDSCALRADAVVGTGAGSFAAAVARGELSTEAALLAARDGAGASGLPREAAAGSASSEDEIVLLVGTESSYAGRRAVALLPGEGELDPCSGVLRALAELWVRGLDVSLEGVYRGEGRRRLPLPTYPFERRRHWYEPKRAPARAEGRSDQVEIAALSWRRDLGAPSSSPRPSTYLVVGNGAQTAADLTARLRASGCRVVEAASRGFDSSATPDAVPQADDLSDLAGALSDPSTVPDRVLYVVGDRGDDATDVAFWRLRRLVASLSRRAQTPALVVVTENAHSIAGETSIRPEMSLVSGPLDAYRSEARGASARWIDVSTSGGRTSAQALLEELDVARTDRVVALRGGERWIPAVEALPRPSAAVVRTRLRQNGVYVVTGGLGGIGLEVAKHLARTVRPRLVLVGRSPFAARERWRSLAEDSPGTREGRRSAALLEIERSGATVEIVRCDVGGPGFEAELERIRRSYGSIDGIFHAAGSSEPTDLQSDRARVAAIVDSKVRGTRAAASALAGRDGALLFLFSSVVGLTGGKGLSDYAAANAFLDAFARSRAGAPGPSVVSVSWDRWAEVGMAATRKVAVAATIDPSTDWRLKEHGLKERGILPATAIVELIAASYRSEIRREPLRIRRLSILRPYAPAQRTELRIEFTALADESHQVRVLDRASLVAVARVERETARPERCDVERLARRCGPAATVPWFRADADPSGRFRHGARWNSLRSVHSGPDETVAFVSLDAEIADDVLDHPFHPALLDIACASGLGDSDRVLVPYAADELRIFAPIPPRIVAHSRPSRNVDHRRDDGEARDFQVFDEAGNELLSGSGYRFRALGLGTLPALVAEPHAENGQEEPGLPGLSTSDAIECLDRIVAGPVPSHVIVTPSSSWWAQGPARAAVDAASSRAAAPAREVPLAELIAQTVGELLGLGRVSVDDDFFDLGADSMLFVRATAKLSELGVDTTPDLFFDHSSAASLAAALTGPTRDGRPRSAPEPAPRDEHVAFSDAGLPPDELRELIERFENRRDG